MFFKEVDPDQLNDAGPHLQKVRSFRQKASGQALFRQFQKSDEWEKLFRSTLEPFVVNRALAQQKAEVASGSTPAPAQPSSSPEFLEQEKQGEKEPGYVNAQSVLSNVSSAVHNGALEFAPRAVVEDFDIARLSLLAGALLSERYPDEFLEIRSMNLLYRFRERVNALPKERYLLMRTLLADQYDLRPGWYWFRSSSEEQLVGALSQLAATDNDPGVRKKTIELLRAAQLRLRPEDMQQILHDDSAIVREAAASFIGTVGATDDLLLLDSIADDQESSVRVAVSQAKLLVTAKSNADDAISQLNKNPDATIAPEILRAISNGIAGAKSEVLVQTLSAPHQEIRLIVSTELEKREHITEDQARALMEEKSPEIKAVAYRALIRMGRQFEWETLRKDLERPFHFLGGIGDLREEVALIQFKSFSPETLQEKCRWLGLEGPIAYKALGLYHFPEFSELIRSDLENGFKRIRDAEIADQAKEVTEKIKQTYKIELPSDMIEMGAKQIEETFKEIDDFVRDAFAASALAALEQHGDAHDVRFARQYLSKSTTSVQTQAIRLIGRFGDSSDVPILMELIKDGIGETCELAAHAVLKLKPGFNQHTKELLETGKDSVVKFATKSLCEIDSLETREVFESLLRSDADNRRRFALIWLANKYSPSELEDLLARYLGMGTYYYDVVCQLDRLLFAPPPLNAHYRSVLDAALA